MTTNTEKSFKDKWDNNPSLAFAATITEGSDIYRWVLERNGFADTNALKGFLAGKRRVLDAGCGNGRVTALLRRLSSAESTEVVGIDLVAADIARANLAHERNVRFEKRDLLGDLSGLGEFDFIYCQEVLHHTADPVKGFRNLCALLEPGGEIAIYVYRKKAPGREFVDDFIRDRIAHLPYEEAREVSRQITELGRALSASGAKVTVPAVEMLGIEAGEYDLQRFVYHFFAKCFWSPELSFDDNVAINYDWYHPQLCSRHTLPEVEQWFAMAGLDVVHRFTDFYGITVRGRRPAAGR
jgi:SAM-dependent methyltransferase